MQNEIILKLLEAHFNDKEIESISLSLKQWDQLLIKANEQNILPIIYEQVLKIVNEEDKKYIKQKYQIKVIQEVSLQVKKTDIFLKLYQYLSQKGIMPLVMKGLICRHIYPSPDLRKSGDEDILVRDEDYQQCHKFMKEYPMLCEEYEDVSHEEEIKYLDTKQMLLIEMHKNLFPGESIMGDNWNTLFTNVHENSCIVQINGISIKTLGHNDHLLYLILHLFKHFLHSGVGIRQICDVIIYAKTYGQEINWEYIYQQCQKVNADYFFLAVLTIGKKYLGFDYHKANIPIQWEDISIDETDLLNDILSGGIYGAVNNEELHGGTYMMNKAKHGKKAIIKTLFPSLKDMQAKKEYLKTKPYLLPIAWLERIYSYLKNGNLKAYQKGKQRSELLKKYKIK